MKRILTITLLLAASMAGAQFEAIRTLTPEQGQEVRRPVEAKVFASSAEELPALEAELLEVFQSLETTLEGKQYTCRMLRYCASEASVPVLAPELANPELEEFVRRVFQSLETADADTALIEALPNGSKIGIIGTLGQRGSKKSVSAIAPYLESDNAELQFAAITALGNIGGKKAVKALQTATVKPAFSNDWKLAQLQAAKGTKTGLFGLFSKGSEKKVVAELLNDEDPGTRCAALVSLTEMNPGKAADLVLAKLDSENREEKTTAKGLLVQLPSKNLIVAAQTDPQIVELLSIRSGADIEAALTALTESEDAAIQQAAFTALGKTGSSTATTELLLSKAITNGDAYNALCALNAEGTDAAIIQALENATDDKVKVKYIECLSARQATTALPLFIELAEGDWSRTCAAAISGMANLVTETDFQTYADLLLSTDNKKKIQALEKSITTAAQRQPDENSCAQPLVAAVGKSEGEAKYAIIRSLGSIGGTKARAVLSEAMASSDAMEKDAAIRGLCNWTALDAAPDLLEIATKSDSTKYRVLAMRGYIRLGGLAGSMGNYDAALKIAYNAAEVAERPEELTALISAIKKYQEPAVLEFLVTQLDNPKASSEAARAIIEISGHWNLKQRSIPALERIAKSDDKALAEEARKRIKDYTK